MANLFKSALVATLFAGALSACSTNNVLTHGATIDQASVHSTTRASNDISRDREAFATPRSDHVSKKGDRSKPLVAAGQEHFQQQNYGLAQKNFQQAVELSSDNASAWLGLAASLDQLGQFKTADRAYQQLLKMKGNNARVLNNVGYSYLLRGDYSKARQYLNRAQNIDPTLEEIQGNIHLLEKAISS